MNTFTLDDISTFDIIVVGSGFYGAVVARQAAELNNARVLIIEKRTHIGGNSYSEIDQKTGIEVHTYGSHIFHTNDRHVWDFVNRFSAFNNYRHRVFTTYQDAVYSMPINLLTINQFYKKSFSPAEAKDFLEKEIARDVITNPKNLEEKAISLIGRPLYEAFVKGYSAKQWQTPLDKLPAHIITRLPVRFNYNDRYFDDTYEGIPVLGYTGLFKSLLNHKNISVVTGVDYFEVKKLIPSTIPTVYTGPIDKYFEYKHGYLGWRTVTFEKHVHDVGDFQGAAVMNYADETVPYTRIHEFKHYHPERKWNDRQTVIYSEFSKTADKSDEPYYPINTEEDKKMLRAYEEEASLLTNVVFGDRLATYKYLDMHQVIGAALVTYDRQIKPLLETTRMSAAESTVRNSIETVR